MSRCVEGGCGRRMDCVGLKIAESFRALIEDPLDATDRDVKPQVTRNGMGRFRYIITKNCKYAMRTLQGLPVSS